MSNPHLIGPLPGTTPPGLGTPAGKRRALPPDLLREASRRLGVMSLLAAALWLVGSVLDHLALRVMTHGDPRWLRLDADDAIAGIAVLVSLGLFAYARRTDRDPRFVLDLGLVYMVLMAAAIGLMIHWDPVPKEWQVSPMITWIGAVVLMFAAIVPSTPAKTVVAALIAVSMNPLGDADRQGAGNLGVRLRRAMRC